MRWNQHLKCAINRLVANLQPDVFCARSCRSREWICCCTLIPVFSHCPHPEYYIVLAQRYCHTAHLSHIQNMRPHTRRRSPPYHFIPLQIRIIRHHPLQSCVVIERSSIDSDISRIPWCLRQRPQSREIDLTHAGGELEVYIFDEVAVLRAVLDAQILMLVVEILVRLREANSWVSGVQEGPVVTASQEAIETVDDSNVHACGIIRSHLGREACQFASWRVVLSADLQTLRCNGGGFVRGWPLRERADGVGVFLAAVASRRADDVAIQHTLYVYGCVFEGLREEGGAVEGLFFASYSAEDDSGSGFCLCEDPRQFHGNYIESEFLNTIVVMCVVSEGGNILAVPLASSFAPGASDV
jgi:hypothetical protein